MKNFHKAFSHNNLQKVLDWMNLNHLLVGQNCQIVPVMVPDPRAAEGTLKQELTVIYAAEAEIVG